MAKLVFGKAKAKPPKGKRKPTAKKQPTPPAYGPSDYDEDDPPPPKKAAPKNFMRRVK